MPTERLVTDEEVTYAMTSPPQDTRAYFRSECLARYAPKLVAASWDALIFDVDGQALKRVPMMGPRRGTAAHVRDLLDANPDPGGLVAALEG